MPELQRIAGKNVRAFARRSGGADFEADGARGYEGRYHLGAKPRLASAEEAAAIVAAAQRPA